MTDTLVRLYRGSRTKSLESPELARGEIWTKLWGYQLTTCVRTRRVLIGRGIVSVVVSVILARVGWPHDHQLKLSMWCGSTKVHLRDFWSLTDEVRWLYKGWLAVTCSGVRGYRKFGTTPDLPGLNLPTPSIPRMSITSLPLEESQSSYFAHTKAAAPWSGATWNALSCVPQCLRGTWISRPFQTGRPLAFWQAAQ